MSEHDPLVEFEAVLATIEAEYPDALAQAAEEHALRAANARFVGVSVNTSRIPGHEWGALFERYGAETGLPVIDPIKDGAGLIVERIEAEFGR